jgi:hypothetical protein
MGTTLPFTAIGCRGDSLLVAWALAHETRSLAGDLGAFFQGGAFHPTPHAILYGEAAFGAVPLFAPVFLATGNPALALNVVLVAGTALTATALHLVTHRWTRLHAAGAVTAATFLATPWVLWTWGPVAPNYVCLFYLPPIVWLAARPDASRGRTALLAALIVLQGLCGVYLAVATLAPLAVLGGVRLLRARTRAAGAAVLAAVLVGALMLAVPYSAYLDVRRANPLLGYQSLFLLVRFGVTSLPWGPFAWGAPAGIPRVAWLVLALGGAAAIAGGLRRAPAPAPVSAWTTTALWIGAALVASLTAEVVWQGRRIAWPLGMLLFRLGAYEMVREPARLALAALVGLALLMGLAFAALAGALTGGRAGCRTAGLRALLAAAVVAGVWATDPAGPLRAPYPVQAAIPDGPWLDAALAAHPGPLLEMPVGPGAYSHAHAMYRAIYHRQPILNGHSGYWPADFPPRMALACRLPDADALRELREITGLTTILVHLDRAGAPAFPAPPPYECQRWDPGVWRAIAARGQVGPLRLVAQHGASLLFAVVDE